MIKLKDVKRLGLSITWRLLYIGVIDRQISTKEVIEYAIEKMGEGEEKNEVRELAISYPDEYKHICNVLYRLISQENTNSDFEKRKIRAVIVNNALKVKNDNYINGLMDLTDLWISLDYPEDSPHTILGKNNSISPSDYFTIDNYESLYRKNIEWLIGETDFLRKNQQPS